MFGINVYLVMYLTVYSLHYNVLPTLPTIPLMNNGPLLPNHTGILLPQPAYNASKPMIISHYQFGIVVFCMSVCVAVAESVHSDSVAVVSGIYYSHH